MTRLTVCDFVEKKREGARSFMISTSPFSSDGNVLRGQDDDELKVYSGFVHSNAFAVLS